MLSTTSLSRREALIAAAEVAELMSAASTGPASAQWGALYAALRAVADGAPQVRALEALANLHADEGLAEVALEKVLDLLADAGAEVAR